MLPGAPASASYSASKHALQVSVTVFYSLYVHVTYLVVSVMVCIL